MRCLESLPPGNRHELVTKVEVVAVKKDVAAAGVTVGAGSRIGVRDMPSR